MPPGKEPQVPAREEPQAPEATNSSANGPQTRGDDPTGCNRRRFLRESITAAIGGGAALAVAKSTADGDMGIAIEKLVSMFDLRQLEIANALIATGEFSKAIKHFLKSGHFGPENWIPALVHLAIRAGLNYNHLGGFLGHLAIDLGLLVPVLMGTTAGDIFPELKKEMNARSTFQLGDNIEESNRNLINESFRTIRLGIFSSGAAAIHLNAKFMEMTHEHFYKPHLDPFKASFQLFEDATRPAPGEQREEEIGTDKIVIARLDELCRTSLRHTTEINPALNDIRGEVDRLDAVYVGHPEKRGYAEFQQLKADFDALEEGIRYREDAQAPDDQGFETKRKWQALNKMIQAERSWANKIGKMLLGDPPNYILLMQLLRRKITLTEFLTIQGKSFLKSVPTLLQDFEVAHKEMAEAFGIDDSSIQIPTQQQVMSQIFTDVATMASCVMGMTKHGQQDVDERLKEIANKEDCDITDDEIQEIYNDQGLQAAQDAFAAAGVSVDIHQIRAQAAQQSPSAISTFKAGFWKTMKVFAGTAQKVGKEVVPKFRRAEHKSRLEAFAGIEILPRNDEGTIKGMNAECQLEIDPQRVSDIDLDALKKKRDEEMWGINGKEKQVDIEEKVEKAIAHDVEQEVRLLQPTLAPGSNEEKVCQLDAQSVIALKAARETLTDIEKEETQATVVKKDKEDKEKEVKSLKNEVDHGPLSLRPAKEKDLEAAEKDLVSLKKDMKKHQDSFRQKRIKVTTEARLCCEAERDLRGFVAVGGTIGSAAAATLPDATTHARLAKSTLTSAEAITGQFVNGAEPVRRQDKHHFMRAIEASDNQLIIDFLTERGTPMRKIRELQEMLTAVLAVEEKIERGELSSGAKVHNFNWKLVEECFGDLRKARKFLMHEHLIRKLEEAKAAEAADPEAERKAKSTNENYVQEALRDTFKTFDLKEKQGIFDWMESFPHECIRIIQEEIGAGTEEVVALVLLQLLYLQSIMPLIEDTIFMICNQYLEKNPRYKDDPENEPMYKPGQVLPETASNNIIAFLVVLCSLSTVADNLVMYMACSKILERLEDEGIISHETFVMGTQACYNAAIEFGAGTPAGGPASAPWADEKDNAMKTGWTTVLGDALANIPHLNKGNFAATVGQSVLFKTILDLYAGEKKAKQMQSHINGWAPKKSGWAGIREKIVEVVGLGAQGVAVGVGKLQVSHMMGEKIEAWKKDADKRRQDNFLDFCHHLQAVNEQALTPAA